MRHEEALQAFVDRKQLFDELCLGLVDLIQELVHQLGVSEVRVEHRIKKAGSFMAKVVDRGEEYQPDPLRAMKDKVGIRIEFLHLADVWRLVELFEHGVEGIEDAAIQIIVPEHGVDGLGYKGVHIDLRPSHPPAGLEPEYAVAELQVRSMGQGLWATASHDIDYKPLFELEDEQKRRVRRLSVLTELFDEEVADVTNEILGDDRYPYARLLEVLRYARATLGRPSTAHPQLTKRVVLDLLGDTFDPVELSNEIGPWANEQTDAILETIRRYEGTSRQFYADRPEGLLAFYLLDRRAYDLAASLDNAGRDRTVVESLAEAWGVELPTYG